MLIMKNVEHIGIAVSNLAVAEAVYSALLNIQPYKREAVDSERVTTSFFKVNQTKIELLEATGPDVPSPASLKKKARAFTTSLLKWKTSWPKWSACAMPGSYY
jgi:methylmalonyl-CoA/ethylmalonyl-CoA epimerase